VAKKKKLNGFQLKQQKRDRGINGEYQKALRTSYEMDRDITTMIVGEKYRFEHLQLDPNSESCIKLNNKDDNLNPLLVPKVPKIDNLDEPFRTDVKQWIKVNPVYREGCWWNATKISLDLPNINVVHGYYSVSKSFDQIVEGLQIYTRKDIPNDPTHLEQIPKELFEENLRKLDVGYNGFVYTGQISRGNNLYIVLRRSKDVYELLIPHTWNVYDHNDREVHFDVNGELLRAVDRQKGNFLQFMNYYSLAKVNYNKVNEHTRSIMDLRIRSWVGSQHHHVDPINNTENTHLVNRVGQISQSVDDSLHGEDILGNWIVKTYMDGVRQSL